MFMEQWVGRIYPCDRATQGKHQHWSDGYPEPSDVKDFNIVDRKCNVQSAFREKKFAIS
jgi:hypothetical protein